MVGLAWIVWFGVIGEVALIEWAWKQRAPEKHERELEPESNCKGVA